MKIQASKTPFVIFSVTQSSANFLENAKATGSMIDLLHDKGIPFKVVQGVYNGTNHVSFLVPTCSVLSKRDIIQLLNHYKQEAILVVNSQRKASLVYLDPRKNDLVGNKVSIGTWREVPESVAKNEESYTCDISTGVYYICVDSGLDF